MPYVTSIERLRAKKDIVKDFGKELRKQSRKRSRLDAGKVSLTDSRPPSCSFWSADSRKWRPNMCDWFDLSTRLSSSRRCCRPRSRPTRSAKRSRRSGVISNDQENSRNDDVCRGTRPGLGRNQSPWG